MIRFHRWPALAALLAAARVFAQPAVGGGKEGAQSNVILVHGDGGLGYTEHAPYDRICVTAACPEVPKPLIEQLAWRGRLIAPVLSGTRQRLTLLERTADGIRSRIIADVLYVSLRGKYGVRQDPHR